MYIQRSVTPIVQKILDQGQIAVIYGARQVGKTTLAKQIASDYDNSLYLSCDEESVALSLARRSSLELKALVGNANIVVIDEAQRVENIGLSLKLLHDTYPDIRVLVTGSSSLDLANKISEPLTGRSTETILYPLSATELGGKSHTYESLLSVLMLRGGYPGLWSLANNDAFSRLGNIASNYLYKDVFSDNVTYETSILIDLLRYLAYQLGNEVNYSEIGSKLSISKNTVQKYIYLLEAAFIVFRRTQYRKNQRVEVGRLRKVYFYDVGIRNALIDNFKPLELRDDVGALWENLCLVERLKALQASGRRVSSYYWRGRGGQEIDLIEEEGDMLRAYECKYSSKKDPKVPSIYASAYPRSSFEVVTPQSMQAKMILEQA